MKRPLRECLQNRSKIDQSWSLCFFTLFLKFLLTQFLGEKGSVGGSCEKNYLTRQTKVVLSFWPCLPHLWRRHDSVLGHWRRENWERNALTRTLLLLCVFFVFVFGALVFFILFPLIQFHMLVFFFSFLGLLMCAEISEL